MPNPSSARRTRENVSLQRKYRFDNSVPNRVLEEHQHSELESWTPTKEATAGHQQIVKEGQSGWVLQAVISRASFRRIPRNGKSYFTMMSLHIHNHYAKKRGIGENLLLAVRTVMRQEQVDMVGGDFNGAAWRRQSGNEQRRNSTMRSSSHLVPKPSGIFACTVRSKSLTKHSVEVTDQNCHHEVWVHLLHVNARLVERTSRDGNISAANREEEELAVRPQSRGNPDDHM